MTVEIAAARGTHYPARGWCVARAGAVPCRLQLVDLACQERAAHLAAEKQLEACYSRAFTRAHNNRAHGPNLLDFRSREIVQNICHAFKCSQYLPQPLQAPT